MFEIYFPGYTEPLIRWNASEKTLLKAETIEYPSNVTAEIADNEIVVEPFGNVARRCCHLKWPRPQTRHETDKRARAIV